MDRQHAGSSDPATDRSIMTTTEPELAALPENLLEVLDLAIHQYGPSPKDWDDLDPIEQLTYRDEAAFYMSRLLTHGAVRRIDDVKAEALAEAAAALRAEAAASKTRDGRFEMETLADLLDARRGATAA